MTALFDSHVIVDWSARSRPSPARPTSDSIWWAVARGNAVGAPQYARTRATAVERLIRLIASERARGHRVLVGFDFPFGYPRGTARVVTGLPSALALWHWLSERVRDAPDNANNRFAVAAEINGKFAGAGPFWGRPATWDFPTIPTTGRARTREGHPPERRHVEARFRTTQPVWKLYTTGSVGSQVLLGLPALARIVAATGAAVWPFDSGLAVPDSPVVLAEIYPSLLARAVAATRAPDEITDAAQVRVNAAAYARLDAAGLLAPLFTGSEYLTASERRDIEAEEAWILGVGHEDRLRSAA